MIKVLARVGLFFAKQPYYTLVTLMIFAGLVFGFVRERQSVKPGRSATRGSATALCSQASVDFQPGATARSIKKALQAVDATIIYGPDEFGGFQIRFSERAGPAARDALRTSDAVDRYLPNDGCPP